MPFKIIRNDITKVKADVIVNTANPKPIYASWTNLAIYQVAGVDALLVEWKKIGDIARGDIAVTAAYALKAKYIIHTVGPVWGDGKRHEFEILESCYVKFLQKASVCLPAFGHARECRPNIDQKALVFRYHVRAGQEQRMTGTTAGEGEE